MYLHIHRCNKKSFIYFRKWEAPVIYWAFTASYCYRRFKTDFAMRGNWITCAGHQMVPRRSRTSAYQRLQTIVRCTDWRSNTYDPRGIPRWPRHIYLHGNKQIWKRCYNSNVDGERYVIVFLFRGYYTCNVLYEFVSFSSFFCVVRLFQLWLDSEKKKLLFSSSRAKLEFLEINFLNNS